jgi:hypothetical protein
VSIYGGEGCCQEYGLDNEVGQHLGGFHVEEKF